MSHLPSVRYQDLFRYRSVWMGFAILSVVVFHSAINLSYLSFWRTFGYGGVDIFFFASGLGCCYSLQRQPDPFRFLAKRIKRILPAYYLVLLIWIPLQIFFLHISLQPLEILNNFLCTSVFSGTSNGFNWYVSGVWLSYLLAPLLVGFVNRASVLQRYLLVPALFLLSVAFLPSSWNLLCTMTRLPIFYIGLLFAKKAQETPTISFRAVMIWILLVIPGVYILLLCSRYHADKLTTLGLWWYPYILIAPGICILLSLLCMLVERFCHWPVALLTLIGNISFELYLTHLTVFGVITYLSSNAIYLPNNTFWCVTILICILLALLLRKVISVLLSLCVGRKAA